MAAELFADYYQWTVTSGGTNAPAAGTSQTFTVSSATGAPPAVTGGGQFRIIDAADTNLPPEIMLVTNVSGTTWTVTRSAEGSATWAHAANWTAIPVLTASGLTNALQASAAGDLTGTYPNPTFALGNPHTWTAGQLAPTWGATGIGGSTAATRYVGGTSSSSPASGTYAVGDFVVDQTNGAVWICTSAGTPGTWHRSQPGGTAGGDLTGTYPSPTLSLGTAHIWTANQTAPALISSGLTGATAASRYVGGTTSGAPTTGTFAVGDYVVDHTGNIWVCTTAGSPGTWSALTSQAHCRLYRSGAWSTSVTQVQFNFDAAAYDPISMGGSGVVTAKVAGYYRVSGQIYVPFTSTAAGDWLMALLYHGTTEISQSATLNTSGAQSLYAQVNDTIQCAVNDTISMQQISNVAVTGGTGTQVCYIAVDWVGQF